MQRFALQVVDDDLRYRWRIWHKAKPADRFVPFMHSLPAYLTYQNALDAGAVMLARCTGQTYENDVGNSAAGDIDLHIDPTPSPRFA